MKSLKCRIVLFAAAAMFLSQTTVTYAASTTPESTTLSEDVSLGDAGNYIECTDDILELENESGNGSADSTDDTGNSGSADNIESQDGTEGTDSSDSSDGVDGADAEENVDVTEETESTETESKTIYNIPDCDYVIEDQNVMVCTNALGGRMFGTAGDTTMAINLNEDITGSTGVKGAEIIAYAFLYVGNAYVYAGTSLTDGCDCSGYVMAVLEHFGISVPHPSAELIYCGGIEVSKEDARLGDVIIYNGGSHAAFYMGNDLILEAEDSANGIVAGNRNAFEDWDGSEKNYVIRRFF